MIKCNMKKTKSKKGLNQNVKAESLKRHGGLNLHPDGVRDEQFVGAPRFFDARDLIQVKYEMLRRVQRDGWSVSQAARTFGFSRPSFYEAQESLEKRGLPGLLPKARGPKGPHKLTEEALRYIESELDSENPPGPEELRKQLIDKFKIEIHPRSIGRAVSKWKKKRRNDGKQND